VNAIPQEHFVVGATLFRSGQLASLGYPTCTGGGCGSEGQGGRTVSFQYAKGFLSKIPGFVDTPVTYWANGMFQDVRHSNGMRVRQEIDPSTMMQRVSQLNMYDVDNVAIFLSGAYAFDGAGNIKAMGTAFNYRYDGVSRLAESRETWGGTTYQQSPTFDSWGNIQALQTGAMPNAPTVMLPTSSASNRLTTTGTTYDPAGNMTSWNGGSTLAYDRLNRMRRFTSGTEDWVFAYATGGERLVSIRVNGGGKIWTVRGLDGQVLREWRADVGVHSFKDYVWTGRDLLAEVQRTPNGGSWTETTLHAGTDHLSSVRKLTDSTGHVVGNHIYYPFGKELTTSQDTERIKWAGYERDLWNTTSTADDLDYLHARHYNPQLGRFLQIDPLAGSISRPQSLNRYAYVVGNPVNAVDPLGLTDYERLDPSLCGPEGCGGEFNEIITVTAGLPQAPNVTITVKPPPGIPYWLLWYIIGNPGGGGNPNDGDDQGHGGGPGGKGPGPETPGPPAPKPPEPPVFKKNERCWGGAFGWNFSFSGPVGIGSDGAPLMGIFGFNIEIVPGGVGIYTVKTVRDAPTSGAAFGVAGTMNWALGSGSWSGRFHQVGANLLELAAGVFTSEHGGWFSGGWTGFEVGASGGPGAGYLNTVANYKPALTFGRSGCL
ncbi:MAG TPA: RHS repeat-associated core domain-containing protein, partial [Geobacteraceae bacterium]